MKDTTVFTAALGLAKPWYVKTVEFKSTNNDRQELHIEVDYHKGAKFEYEGDHYSVYDHQERTWRHLRFFQHDCYLHARVPRVKTKQGKVKLVQVPWSQAGSSFTLLFEQDVLRLLQGDMSASAVGRYYAIDSRVVFRMMARQVSGALSEQDLSDVRQLASDETSRTKGHKYLTILSDREAKKVVGIAVGKDKEAFAHALIDMEVRGADRGQVRCVSMDMSRSYIAAAEELLPDADIVFDRFHIAKQLNAAVDRIRRSEQATFHKQLKNSRYLWLYNRDKLNAKQQQRVDQLAKAFPTLGQAYRLKETFREVLNQASISASIAPLDAWIEQAWASGLAPIQDFVNMLHNHWYGIETYFTQLASNAFAERVNLKIQDIKRVAKGYRNAHHFSLMIYFHLGGLDFKIH